MIPKVQVTRKKREMSGQEPGDEKEYHEGCLNYSVPSKTE